MRTHNFHTLSDARQWCLALGRSLNCKIRGMDYVVRIDGSCQCVDLKGLLLRQRRELRDPLHCYDLAGQLTFAQTILEELSLCHPNPNRKHSTNS